MKPKDAILDREARLLLVLRAMNKADSIEPAIFI
jgi:hypothetical protein